MERVTRGHVPVLADLHRQSFEDPWPRESISALLETPGTFGYIATDPETAAPHGFVLARMAAGEAEILTIGVLPEARSRRIGGALVGAVVATEGVETLFLDVAADNESALRLYRREGFDVVGGRPGYYERRQGARVDSLTMKRVLG